MTWELESYEGICMEGFAERLKEARAARGLTQVRLAELLEISPRVYNRWERGAAIPKLDTVVKIAEILEVSIDQLVGLKDHDDSDFRLRNPELHRMYKEIDTLSDEDQQALIVLLDSLVKRSQMQKLITR